MSTNHTWLTYLPTFIRKRVEGRQALQKIIGNSGWMLFDKIFRLGLAFILNIWVTRYLGPAQFGMLSYASAFVSLFLAIANLGLFGIVIRDVVRYPDERHEILGTALFLKLGGGVVCLALSIVSILLIHPDNPKTVLLVAIVASGMIFQAFDVFDFWFISQLQSKSTLMANLPAFVLCSAMKVGLIIKGASLVAFAWVAFAEIILSAIGYVAVYQSKTDNILCLRVKRVWISRLLKDSTPLIFAGLMIMVYNRIDQVMLGSLLGDSSVGLYSAAVKLAEFWYVFPGLVLQSLFSTIVTSRESGTLEYERTMQRVFDSMVLISAIFVLPLVIGARWLVVHLYGSAYSEAGPLLGVYVFSGIFVMLGHAREYWVTSENITRFSLYSATVGALVNISLNLVLIPRYGPIGAAYSTLIALVIGSYLINICSSTTRPVFRMQTKALLFFPAVLRLMREARGLSKVSDVNSRQI